MPKILTQDINGNWVYMDIGTKEVTSAAPQQGTIQRNAQRQVNRMRKDNRRYNRPKLKSNSKPVLKPDLEKLKRQNIIASNDNIWVDVEDKEKNPQIESTPSQTDDFAQEHPNLTKWRNLALATPFAVAAYPLAVGAGNAAAGTTIGTTATNGLMWLSNAAKATPWIQRSWPWANAALTSTLGAHGLNEMRQGRFTPETALEIAPLISPAKKTASFINEGVNAFKTYAPNAYQMARNVANTNSNPYNWRNYRFLGDKRFYSDLNNISMKDLMSDRVNGLYPLTFSERRKYVTGLKNDIQKGVDAALNEAQNIKAPLTRKLTININDKPMVVSKTAVTPTEILQLPIHYGTLKATRESGETPWEGQYAAFQNGRGLFFPFRNRPNTLRTHLRFRDIGERIATGAHEARHTVLKYFDIPLVRYRKDMPGTYKRYTHEQLPLDFKRRVNSYINDAETAGEWEGSLAEMDAELSGWTAAFGWPRYSLMTPIQKAKVHLLFQKRFNGSADYKNWGEISTLLRLNPDDNLSLYYGKKLDNNAVGQIILGLEDLGYRKQGGKLCR